ncbi:molybdopterin converting factor subunit 1 [Telmatospirillum sp.]|uniref:molybdopterin converting factor subunit 1 n=1 Tax=Telmatospirillum sp. TaxID=2079197 RepID=UPI00283EDB34|nr:molybdopterin converting factor subunit 1 [Telmatospirillum sp.]MDR3438466.1 molybdopterin converting factor subunit 1 [Telmatospirillum sp.]
MKILYFAWLRSRIGTGEEDVSPPSDVDTVGKLIDWLKSRSPAHAEALSKASVIRAAVNQDYAGLDHAVSSSDEVAFFPPVTGGSA